MKNKFQSMINELHNSEYGVISINYPDSNVEELLNGNYDSGDIKIDEETIIRIYKVDYTYVNLNKVNSQLTKARNDAVYSILTSGIKWDLTRDIANRLIHQKSL